MEFGVKVWYNQHLKITLLLSAILLLVFMDKIGNMIPLYSHTEQACFDIEKIYLIADRP